MTPEESCRLDVWLWRARFFRTRSLAARFIEQGRLRLSRAGAETRVDKPGRTVRPGDALVFALGGRVIEIRVLACGERRGPASEARTLYAGLDGAPPFQPPGNTQSSSFSGDAQRRPGDP